MTSSLFFYAHLPAPDSMTSPYLVFYENGDWNIELGGDVHYFGGDSFVSQSCVTVLQMFTEEEFDQDSDGTAVDLELVVESRLEEPVVLIWNDGRITAGDRFQADKLILNQNANFYNFIPLAELVDDLQKFITRNEDIMLDDDYGDDDFQPLNFDED